MSSTPMSWNRFQLAIITQLDYATFFQYFYVQTSFEMNYIPHIHSFVGIINRLKSAHDTIEDCQEYTEFVDLHVHAYLAISSRVVKSFVDFYLKNIAVNKDATF